MQLRRQPSTGSHCAGGRRDGCRRRDQGLIAYGLSVTLDLWTGSPLRLSTGNCNEAGGGLAEVEAPLARAETRRTMSMSPGWYPDPEDKAYLRYHDGQNWTDNRSPATATATVESPKKRHRVFLWFFLAVQAIFIIWIIAGAASGGGTATDCQGLTQQECEAAEGIGTGIGVALIVVIWMVVDFFLAVIYGIYRLAKRPS